MPIDLMRQLLAALGGYPSYVPSLSGRDVKTLPAHQLRTPSEVGVFAIGKEVFVEELAVNGDSLDEWPTKHDRCPRCAKHPLRTVVLTFVLFLCAAIQMPHISREIDSGRIDKAR